MSRQPITPPVSFQCKTCGKTFLVPAPQLVIKGRGNYCSRACRNVGFSAPPDSLLVFKCRRCGKSFSVPSCQMGIPGRGAFCSRECSRSPRVTLNCQTCGEPFVCTVSQANRGRKYCSWPCTKTGTGPQDTEQLFWAKVNKTDSCWLWTAGTDGNSYGYFHGRIRDRYTTRAHVYAWLLLVGDIPEGLCVCHNCPGGDNPLCVNPSHMFLGTKAENQLDMARKGRNHLVRKLGDARVLVIRSRYAAGGVTQKELAAEYGVSVVTIQRVLSRQIYFHI